MRPYDAARLYWVRLRGRSVFVQETLAVVGIAIGVALLFASQVLSTSLGGSVQQLANAIAGHSQLQVRARSATGFAESEFGSVLRLPGVRSAVPILEQSVTLIGDRGSQPVDLLATDPRYASLAGRVMQQLSPQRHQGQLGGLTIGPGTQRSLLATRAFASASLLILLPPVAAAIERDSSTRLKIQVGGRIVPAAPIVLLKPSKLDPLLGSRIAFAPLSYAQQLTGMVGRLTRILVQAQPGQLSHVRTELRALAAGRQNVQPTNFDATLFNQAATPVNQSTTTFAGICALLGFMFAYCSILLTAATRRRLIKDLHLAGATRRQILHALLFDAFVLGSFGAVLGLALGELLSVLAFEADPGFLSLAFPVGSRRIVTWQSIALAVGAGLLAACIGVLSPLWDISDGRASAPRSRRRAAPDWLPRAMPGAGVACLIATTAVLLATPGSAIVGIFTLLVALLLVLPLLLGALLGAFERLQRLTGARAMAIALLELRAPSTRLRSIAIASTAAVAVFGSVTIDASRANLQTGLNDAFHGITSVANLWVTPAGSQSLVGTVPFDGPPTSSFLALPGVRAAGIYRAGFLDVGNRRAWVIAPSPTASSPLPTDQIVQGSITTATARLREGGWAVISRTLANEMHAHVGQRFTLPSPKPISLRVAALMTNLGWPPGAVMLNSRDYMNAWESAAPTAYNILLSPGASSMRVGHEIEQLLTQRGFTGLTVQTASERERNQVAAARKGLERLTQMTILALIAGILATGTSLAAVLSQRRRQVARLKTQGLPRNLLWMALVSEGALLIGAGCLIGAAFGIYGQLLLSHALVSVTGFPVSFSPRLYVALEGLAIVTLAAAAVIVVPGYRAANVRPSRYL